MVSCRYCGVRFERIHECADQNRSITEAQAASSDESEGDFLLSAVIGAATDSAILGGLIGGDDIGGIVGDLLDGDLFD